PGKKLEAVPLADPLYSEALNGTAIKTVRRREKAGGAGADGGFQDLPPALEGIKVDGRWVVLYSKYDLGCALEGNKSTECLAHDLLPEVAGRELLRPFGLDHARVHRVHADLPRPQLRRQRPSDRVDRPLRRTVDRRVRDPGGRDDGTDVDDTPAGRAE